MRHSLPVVLALAAFTAAGFSGPASAISNNLNPWSTTSNTTKKPPATQTKQNPPPTQTNQNTPPATQAKSAPSTHANQTPSGAAQTTAPNSPTTQTSSNPGNQIKPAADPKKDIVQQTQDIKKYEGYITDLKQMKQEAAEYVSGPRIDSKFGPTICDSSGCTRTYKTMSFGGPGVTIKIRVDSKGNALPGEGDKMTNAVSMAIDKAIDANVRRIADAKKQLAADYSVIPDPAGGVNNHTGSTALHQD